MVSKHSNIISKRLYDRVSRDYGKYKVISFDIYKGKSKVEYYKCKFKDSGNIISAPIKTILSNNVVDIERKKKTTKKKNRVKKKVNKYEKYCLYLDKDSPVRLLALDLATISTGVSVSINGKVKAYDYIFISNKTNNLTERINYMKIEITKIIKKYKINACVLEDVINKNFRSTVALSKLSGVIIDLLFELNIPTLKVAPVKWKADCNINQYKNIKNMWSKNSREESKELTYLYVKDVLNIDVKKKTKNIIKEHQDKEVWQDLADSLAINDVTYKKYIKFKTD